MLALILFYAALGDPLFEAREAAEKKLERLVDRHPWVCGPRLSDLVKTASDPEIALRGGRAVKPYDRARISGFVPGRVPFWPICDAFPCQHPCIPFGLVDVRDRTRWPRLYPSGDGGPGWLGYRKTTEHMIREKLRLGASWEECDLLLERMFALEVGHRHDCNMLLGKESCWRGGYLAPPGYNR